MANPRIEEIEDDFSDPEEMDVEAFDFARPQGNLQSTADPADTQIDTDELQKILGLAGQSTGGAAPSVMRGPPAGMTDKQREQLHREQVEKTRKYQCIYPIYFDASRTREQGRRVCKADAVQNPLAREIVDALQHIGAAKQIPFAVAFEPTKTHPRDWANPGRIRVLVKEEGRVSNAKITSKTHLYKLIAEYLKSHPTTADAPLKLRFQGMPAPPDGKVPTPAVPRGAKIGSILPLHSPALTGGGVNDSFLQDMMQQMGGALPGVPAAGPSQKKIKVVRR